MRKNKDDLVLEEYIDDDFYQENFYSIDNKSKKLSEEEEEYNNFFKVDDDYSNGYDIYVEDNNDDDGGNIEAEDDEDNPAYTYDSSSSLYKFLSIFLVVFKWLGIAIAVVLIAYFITQGRIKSLLLYILGLVVAFFFGYFFMFLLNRFTEE